MRHRVGGRKLGRVTSHKLATMRNLATALFERDRIRTTLMKAKEVRPFAERLVTLSKKGGLHRRRLAGRHIHDPRVLRKLFDTISARYLDRPGGYTRILRIGRRQGDGAEMALLEMVGMEETVARKSAKPDKTEKGTKPGRAAQAGTVGKAKEEDAGPKTRKRKTGGTDAPKTRRSTGRAKKEPKG